MWPFSFCKDFSFVTVLEVLRCEVRCEVSSDTTLAIYISYSIIIRFMMKIFTIIPFNSYYFVVTKMDSLKN